MSDIEQKMGFDASQAIATLANLDKSMQALNASVTAAPAGFTAFNAKAGKTVAALKHLSSNAKIAATELQKVASLQGRASAIPKQATPVTAAKAATSVKPPDLSSYISQLQSMYKIAGTASKEQKRAFQTAITAAAEYASKHKKTAADLASTNADMTQNMTGTANKMADALAKISGRSRVAIPAPDTSRYAVEVQKLIPLSKKATDAQKRNWLSMSTKIAEAALNSGMSINQLIAIHGMLGQSLTGPANKIANDMQKMSSAGQTATNGMTVTWQTMTRVMATQAIVRALSAIRAGLRAAVKDAVKFQRSVAEIGTIGRELGTADDIGSMVNRVSDQFNVGLAGTAEAAYQTVSNQIASTQADVESFLGSAAKFSKVTKTDMATSVNLLSGVLNAFGKEVGETDDVAAKFFKTIELGRTRAEELAQGYGTVAPIADKLGISMEELNASVATLTINGIKTDKAFTQIRGTMQGFLKPTTAMKAAMRELGFATGEQVLEAYNLQDAVRAVTGTTEGNAAAIAKLFPRIRGLTGVLTLVNDEAQHFNRTLKEQHQALQDAYDKAYKLVIETDAEKVTKDLNKLKNFFTVEFGQSVLAAFNDMSQFVGGADTVIVLLTSMGRTLPVVAAGLGAVGIAMGALALKAKIMAIANGVAAASFTLLQASLGIVAVISASVLAMQMYNTRVANLRAADIADAASANDEAVAKRQLSIDKELSAEKHKFEQLKKFRAKELAENRKAYMDRIDVAQDSNSALVTSTKWALDGIVKSRLAAVEAIKSAAIEADKAVEKSQKTAASLAVGLEDTLFQRGLDATESDTVKLRKIMQKSAEESQRALSLMSSATTDQEHEIAMSAHKRAIALNEQAYSLTQSTDNDRYRLQVNSSVEQMTKKMIEAEKKYGSRLKETSANLKVSAKDAAGWAAALKGSQDKIAKLADQTKDGEFMSQSDMTANRKELEKEMEKFFKIVDIGVDRFGADASPLVQKLVENLAISEAELEVQTLLALPANMDSIQQEVKSSFEAFFAKDPARVKVQFYADKKGINLEDMGSFNLAKAGQSEAEQASSEGRAGAKKAEVEYQNSLTKSLNILKEITQLSEVSHIGVGGEAMMVPDDVAIGINKLQADLVELANQGPKTIAEVNKIATAGRALQDSLSTGLFGKGGDRKKYDQHLGELNTAMQKLGQAAIIRQRASEDAYSSFANQSSAEVKSLQEEEAVNKRANGMMETKHIMSLMAEGDAQKKAAAQQLTMAAIKEESEAVGVLAQKYLESRASANAAANAVVQPKPPTNSTEAGDQRFQNPFIEAKTGADQLQSSVDGINMKLQSTNAAQDGHASAVSNTQAAVDNLVASYGQLLQTVQAAASAQSSLSSGAVTAAKGGPLGYFASGGRGTDTIPAMLSEGEFVVNAKSSRRFFSQLQAMNAGRTPVYRESGGSTTNIGDVSINVSESSSPRQTGREVMQAFRREIRRGSGRI